jgi:hypothetical protein
MIRPVGGVQLTFWSISLRSLPGRRHRAPVVTDADSRHLNLRNNRGYSIVRDGSLLLMRFHYAQIDLCIGDSSRAWQPVAYH